MSPAPEAGRGSGAARIGWIVVTLALVVLAAFVVLRVRRDPEETRADAPAVGPAAAGGTRVLRDEQLSRARALLEAGDYAGASSAIDRALEAAPDDPEALAMQVRALGGQRRYAAALQAAGRILAASPGSPLGHILTGSIALQQGDAASCRRSLERALALDPDAVSATSRLAALDLMEGRVEEARRNATRALAIDPDNAAGLAVIASLSRSVPELASVYERLVAIDPGDMLARGWLQALRATRAAAVDRVAAPDGVSIPLEREHDGRLVILVDLGPDAAGLRFLLDTGASGLVLSEAIARGLGIPLHEISMSTGIGGLSRHSHPLVLSRVDVSGVSMRDVMSIATETPAGFAGLLNPLLLAPPGSGLEVELRSDPPELVLRPAAGIARTGRVTLPYLADGRHPLVRIMLGGRPAMALLDTGSAVDLLDRALLGRVSATTAAPARAPGLSLVGFGGVIEDAELAQSVDLRIAGVDFPRSHVLVLDLNREPFRFQVDIDAIVGIETLRRFDIGFDPGAGTISLLPVE